MLGFDIHAGLNATGFKAGLEQIQRQVMGLNARLNQAMGGAVVGWAKSFLAVGAVIGLARKGITEYFDAINKAKEIVNKSTKIGIDYQLFQLLENAATQAGISVDSVSNAMLRLAKQQGELITDPTSETSKDIALAYRILGIEADKAADQNYHFSRQYLDMMRDLRSAASRHKVTSEQMWAGMTLMGRNFGEQLQLAARGLNNVEDIMGRMTDSQIENFTKQETGWTKAAQLGKGMWFDLIGLAEKYQKIVAHPYNPPVAAVKAIWRWTFPDLGKAEADKTLAEIEKRLAELMGARGEEIFQEDLARKAREAFGADIAKLDEQISAAQFRNKTEEQRLAILKEQRAELQKQLEEMQKASTELGDTGDILEDLTDPLKIRDTILKIEQLTEQIQRLEKTPASTSEKKARGPIADQADYLERINAYVGLAGAESLIMLGQRNAEYYLKQFKINMPGPESMPETSRRFRHPTIAELAAQAPPYYIRAPRLAGPGPPEKAGQPPMKEAPALTAGADSPAFRQLSLLREHLTVARESQRTLQAIANSSSQTARKKSIFDGT